MNVEPKYCESCQRQFFRSAEKHPWLREKYCASCEKQFKAVEFEQLHNDEIKDLRFAVN